MLKICIIFLKWKFQLIIKSYTSLEMTRNKIFYSRSNAIRYKKKIRTPSPSCQLSWLLASSKQFLQCVISNVSMSSSLSFDSNMVIDLVKRLDRVWCEFGGVCNVYAIVLSITYCIWCEFYHTNQDDPLKCCFVLDFEWQRWRYWSLFVSKLIRWLNGIYLQLPHLYHISQFGLKWKHI